MKEQQLQNQHEEMTHQLRVAQGESEKLFRHNQELKVLLASSQERFGELKSLMDEDNELKKKTISRDEHLEELERLKNTITDFKKELDSERNRVFGLQEQLELNNLELETMKQRFSSQFFDKMNQTLNQTQQSLGAVDQSQSQSGIKQPEVGTRRQGGKGGRKGKGRSVSPAKIGLQKIRLAGGNGGPRAKSGGVPGTGQARSSSVSSRSNSQVVSARSRSPTPLRGSPGAGYAGLQPPRDAGEQSVQLVEDLQKRNNNTHAELMTMKQELGESKRREKQLKQQT